MNFKPIHEEYAARALELQKLGNELGKVIHSLCFAAAQNDGNTCDQLRQQAHDLLDLIMDKQSTTASHLNNMINQSLNGDRDET